MVETQFKNTDIGLIPEDWNLVKIEDIAGVFGGGTPSTINNKFWGGSINWFTPTEVGKKKYLTKSNRTLTELGLQNCSGKILPVGSILITTRAGIGDVGILTIESATNQGFQSLIPNSKINPEFLYYITKTLKPVLLQNSSGSTFLEISPSKVKSIQIPLPPLPEQQAIAEVLSDTDAWIESLEKLIAKKRLVKQGAMQQLLTPKEDWEVKKLGEMSQIYTGNKNNQDKSEDGIYPFFVRSQKIEKINTYTFDGEAILIPGEGNLGSIFHYINGKFDFHQRVYKVSDFNGINGKYLFWYFRIYFGKHALQNTVKATVDSIRLPTIQEFEVFFPEINEQTRIATILSDMDAEIEHLEKKLNKAKQLKQGIMQQLLTGKIRLIAGD
ncbi:restriction endonuclease subunit S [Flavobacterium davisii]|uniref:restriction endonuclease subunit S n=1 Tax=Flavobacterium davisii TaxID=2906077 RepID=UPI0035CFE735